MSFEKTVNKLAGLDAFMRREAKLITGEGIVHTFPFFTQ